MKPLFIFLFLLVILIISLLFRRYFEQPSIPVEDNEEGFISFTKDINVDSKTKLTIPQYSTSDDVKVYKLYDSIFYDPRNGYVIEVDGVDTEGTDNLGFSIDGIHIITRDGKINNKATVSGDMYKTSLECSGNTFATRRSLVSDVSIRANCTINSVTREESKVNSLTTTNQSWKYFTRSTNTSKYSIIYYAYDILTIIHIIDNTNKRHIITYYFVGTTEIKSSRFSTTDSITVSTPKTNDDINNDTYVIDTSYDSKIKVYQFSDTVKIDDNNGYLIVTNKQGDGTVTVYNRIGVKQTDFKGSLPVDMVKPTTFKPWIVSDGNNSQILYIAFSRITLLIEIIYNTTEQKFESRKTFITGDYNNSIIVKNAYSSGTSQLDLDKYILKTQIVPPVCPSCPNCSCHDGVCTNCGGNGGSGSYDRSEYIKNKFKNFFKNGRNDDDDEDDIPGEDRSEKIKRKFKNFFKEGRHTNEEELLEDGENRSAKINSKIKNFFKEGRHPDGEEYDSDEEEYLKGNLSSYNSNINRYSLDDLYDDDKNKKINTDYWWNKSTEKQYRPTERELKEQNENIRNTYNVPQTATPSTIPGVDMYSYFGALVPKGGYNNYVPVTADFSTFGL